MEYLYWGYLSLGCQFCQNCIGLGVGIRHFIHGYNLFYSSKTEWGGQTMPESIFAECIRSQIHKVLQPTGCSPFPWKSLWMPKP